LSEEQVLFKIADACHKCKDGINQVLFITSGRFTEEEITAYDILRTVLFDHNIVKYTTIIRTKFPQFDDPEECKNDILLMKNDNKKLANILETCNKIIYVNNLTKYEEKTLDSRKKVYLPLITFLSSCKDLYRPTNLNEINMKIEKHINEKDIEKQKIQLLKNQFEFEKK